MNAEEAMAGKKRYIEELRNKIAEIENRNMELKQFESNKSKRFAPGS